MAKKSFEHNQKYLFHKATILLVGIGLGALLANPVFGSHPVRWGLALAAVGIAGHFYFVSLKK